MCRDRFIGSREMDDRSSTRPNPYRLERAASPIEKRIEVDRHHIHFQIHYSRYDSYEVFTTLDPCRLLLTSRPRRGWMGGCRGWIPWVLSDTDPTPLEIARGPRDDSSVAAALSRSCSRGHIGFRQKRRLHLSHICCSQKSIHQF